MKITPSVIVGLLFAVLLLVLVLRIWVKGGIVPPHEFAYGTALRNCEAIPERMDQLLSLDAMDSNEIQIETFVGNQEKAIQFVKTLLPYKDFLRNEAQQDTVIVFVYYGLKQPSNLSQAARVEVSNLVKQLDTPKQSAESDSGECPKNFLVGNLNIYPLALENTSWHTTVEFAAPKEAPVLEIRFMGLRGVFRYLLDEMTRKTGDSFVHLDGESI